MKWPYWPNINEVTMLTSCMKLQYTELMLKEHQAIEDSPAHWHCWEPTQLLHSKDKFSLSGLWTMKGSLKHAMVKQKLKVLDCVIRLLTVQIICICIRVKEQPFNFLLKIFIFWLKWINIQVTWFLLFKKHPAFLKVPM